MSPTTASKHLAEDVIHATTAAAFFETLFAIFVVNIPFFFVGEYFIGILEFLEFFFVATTVWMVFKC